MKMKTVEGETEWAKRESDYITCQGFSTLFFAGMPRGPVSTGHSRITTCPERGCIDQGHQGTWGTTDIPEVEGTAHAVLSVDTQLGQTGSFRYFFCEFIS